MKGQFGGHEIDLGMVLAEIGKTEGRELSFTEMKDARECVWIAAERWVERDAEILSLASVETDHACRVDGHAVDFHGILDVTGIFNSRTDKVFGEFKGRVCIVDWKTKEAGLDSRWREDMKNSWQWRLYAHLTGAAVVWYRGISRTQKDTAEVIIAVPPSNDEECRDFLEAVYAERQALVDGKFLVWPRRMPYSCNAFGRPCPFKDDCTSGYTMPQVAVPARQLSYSSISDFMLCPERHRRKAILGSEGREDTDATIFGSAVHRGLAEIYRQILDKQ